MFVFVTPTFYQFSRAQPQGGSLTIRVISCSVKKIESSIFFISASTVALPSSDHFCDHHLHHHWHNDHSTPRTSLTWTGWGLPIRAILMSRFVDLSVQSSVRPFSKSVKILFWSCYTMLILEFRWFLNVFSPQVICGAKMAKTEVIDDEPEHPKFNETTSTFTFAVS